MIAKAIDKIISLAKPLVINVDGTNYSTENLRKVDKGMRAEPIHIQTLSGLLDYMYVNRERFDGWDGYIVRVCSEKMVELISELDSDRKRERIIVAEAETPILPTQQFMDNERFLIGLQANFVDVNGDTDLAAVLKFAGTVTDGTITDYKDDGVTQKATVKVGISSKAEGIVPNPAILRPYRTFLEIEQPASKFIFRMQEGPKCALFEADGGKWKIDAMQSIKEYMITALGVLGIEVAVIA